MEKFDELLEQLQKHLDCGVQSWFLGAGVSSESNVPLMSSLTERVEALVQKENSEVCKKIYAGLKKDLPVGSNIEQILSHIGDFLTLAERSVSKKSQISGDTYLKEDLKEVYQALIKHIGKTIRYGYRAPNLETGTKEQIGSLENRL